MAGPLMPFSNPTLDGTGLTLGSSFNGPVWIPQQGGVLAYPQAGAAFSAGLGDNRLLAYKPGGTGRAIPNAGSATDALFKIDLHSNPQRASQQRSTSYVMTGQGSPLPRIGQKLEAPGILE
jgi:hypothetical protein